MSRLISILAIFGTTCSIMLFALYIAYQDNNHVQIRLPIHPPQVHTSAGSTSFVRNQACFFNSLVRLSPLIK